jgi:hypothetical protein
MTSSWTSWFAVDRVHHEPEDCRPQQADDWAERLDHAGGDAAVLVSHDGKRCVDRRCREHESELEPGGSRRKPLPWASAPR